MTAAAPQIRYLILPLATHKNMRSTIHATSNYLAHHSFLVATELDTALINPDYGFIKQEACGGVWRYWHDRRKCCAVSTRGPHVRSQSDYEGYQRYEGPRYAPIVSYPHIFI